MAFKNFKINWIYKKKDSKKISYDEIKTNCNKIVWIMLNKIIVLKKRIQRKYHMMKLKLIAIKLFE